MGNDIIDGSDVAFGNHEFVTDLRVFVTTSVYVSERDIVNCIVEALSKLEASSETVISPSSQSLK